MSAAHSRPSNGRESCTIRVVCGPGGGGSGYINTSKLTDAVMYGYKVTTSSSVESKTCSTSNKSSNAVSNFAKEGNGFARITLL